MKTKFDAVDRDKLNKIFNEIDSRLLREDHSLDVTVLGGVSIIFLEYRDRATVDIDIANGHDAGEFQKACSNLGIPVDIIAVSATVDFSEAPTVEIFRGKKLIVRSVIEEDLIKLKLERFRKQDPEDIYAIIEKAKIGFEKFQLIVKEMLPDFIGNTRGLVLSARLVVERMYSGRLKDFSLE